jgi:uncharacterized lipoprotein YajG
MKLKMDRRIKMKAIILLLLVLSFLFVGCTTKTTTPEANTPPGPDAQVTEDQALNEVDNSLLSEQEDVQIGEMI